MIKGFTFYWSRRRNLKTSAVFQGLVWALGVNLSICFILGLWAILSPLGTYYFTTLLIAGALSGVFAGGLASGWISKNSGWFHGGLTGFCYGLVFIILSLISEPYFFIALDLAGRLGLYTLGGMAGGIVGVNLSSSLGNKKLILRHSKKTAH